MGRKKKFNFIVEAGPQFLTPEIIKKFPTDKKREFVFTPGRRDKEPRLEQAQQAIRTPAYRRMIEVDKSKPHRFYRLPPEKRQVAQEYFDMLCRRHSDRLAKTPKFANVLHMITLNQIKNPGQSNQAVRIKHYKRRAKKGFLQLAPDQEAARQRKREMKANPLPRSAQLPL